ncbi:MAG: Gfo/Idh/MocA family oxidoreductase, partial [Hyphomicrobiales bacterium]|nr:Gfo/Idh/MocA family oxidoreductase [Hyphomicrobiales bacterium]
APGNENGLQLRVYGDWETMARAEAARPDGVEAVAIVTPNHAHAGPVRGFLEAGFDVICDKPLTTTLAEARALAADVARSGRVFALTHNYTGYPLVRQMRAMVREGRLGRLRLVHAEYPQDWLTLPIERDGQKQAEWRTDPARSGAGGAIGDIGTHAFNLAEFVTGLKAEAVSAELTSFVPGRALDDDAQIRVRWSGGARGAIWCSQVAPGNENGLQLRVYGETGGMHWRQDDPNRLYFTAFGEPTRILTRGGAGTGSDAARATRIPAGHPEGYLEAFANVYVEAAAAIRARRAGLPAPPDLHYPGVEDGVRGLAFVEASVASSKTDGAWTKLDA